MKIICMIFLDFFSKLVSSSYHMCTDGLKKAAYSHRFGLCFMNGWSRTRLSRHFDCPHLLAPEEANTGDSNPTRRRWRSHRPPRRPPPPPRSRQTQRGWMPWIGCSRGWPSPTTRTSRRCSPASSPTPSPHWRPPRRPSESS